MANIGTATSKRGRHGALGKRQGGTANNEMAAYGSDNEGTDTIQAGDVGPEKKKTPTMSTTTKKKKMEKKRKKAGGRQ